MEHTFARLSFIQAQVYNQVLDNNRTVCEFNPMSLVKTYTRSTDSVKIVFRLSELMNDTFYLDYEIISQLTGEILASGDIDSGNGYKHILTLISYLD